MTLDGTSVLVMLATTSATDPRPNLVHGGQPLQPGLDKDLGSDYPRRHFDEVLSMGKKPGRNQPCPCGSGKKYKRCCLRTTSAQTTAIDVGTTSNPALTGAMCYDPATGRHWTVLDDPLDDLSNKIVDLLREGRIDEAEATWDELNREFPNEIDPIERKAMILEARGENSEAARYYRQAARFTKTHEGFESGTTQHYLDRATQLEARADLGVEDPNGRPTT